MVKDQEELFKMSKQFRPTAPGDLSSNSFDSRSWFWDLSKILGFLFLWFLFSITIVYVIF